MTKHFLITNRKVTGAPGAERIEEDGREEASDLFRIAEWNGVDFDVLPDTPPNEVVQYTDIIQEDSDLSGFTGSKRLFYELYKTMAFGGGADVLFYIHGFNNNMQSVREAMADLVNLYANSPVSPVKQIVIFSWPARNDIRYRDDYRDARNSGYTMARATLKYGEFLDQFFQPNRDSLTYRNEPCGKRLHLMCHSMGNYVFESMINELRTQRWSRNIFKQVILTASDVDYSVFESPQAFSRLTEYCERATVYFNKHDKAMYISSSTKNPATRLGTGGPRVAAAVPTNVVLVDATEVAPIGVSLQEGIIGHAYHLNSPIVIEDMSLTLSGLHSEDIQGREFIQHKNAYRLTEDADFEIQLEI